MEQKSWQTQWQNSEKAKTRKYEARTPHPEKKLLSELVIRGRKKTTLYNTESHRFMGLPLTSGAVAYITYQKFPSVW